MILKNLLTSLLVIMNWTHINNSDLIIIFVHLLAIKENFLTKILLPNCLSNTFDVHDKS